MTEWKPWFAWHPVTLLTMQVVWLRWLQRRPTKGWHHFSSRKRKWDYAWPSTLTAEQSVVTSNMMNRGFRDLVKRIEP